LSHEAIIDTVWDTNIRPLLLQRFPQTTEAQLKAAHANAYAGCIIQDLGYYPFGNHRFSDLLHYVRSGDFVVNLLRSAQTVNEYAFALGALSHYASDTQGHAIAVNRSVPVQYRRLAREFGPVVTYGDDKPSHLRVEFAFDVLQVARGNYAPQGYHDFIGFEVATGVLERAFVQTYSLRLDDVFSDVDASLRTYRHTVSSIIPKATRVAWDLKKDDLRKAQPTITRSQFVYNLSRASYQKEWKGAYRTPGAGSKLLALLIAVLPKVGPLQPLGFKAPTTQTTQWFETSFNRTLAEYRRLLGEEAAHRLVMANRNFDTGALTRPGEYALADNAYAGLARDLAAMDPAAVNADLRRNVLEFYKDLGTPVATQKHAREWRDTVKAIEKLRSEVQTSARGE
jgi:hypothetical protein